eukprot:TRINITY_DN3324_c0_g2_i1.p1 TRINITY_DN3324_c0_g2~~TRINITY_DN3324_c0_g2_i1.p1  ORF type:complete len:354 (-),score=29.50 TRINITY_DN3324_c0_g2_i1:42-1103(-)
MCIRDSINAEYMGIYYSCCSQENNCLKMGCGAYKIGSRTDEMSPVCVKNTKGPISWQNNQKVTNEKRIRSPLRSRSKRASPSIARRSSFRHPLRRASLTKFRRFAFDGIKVGPRPVPLRIPDEIQESPGFRKHPLDTNKRRIVLPSIKKFKEPKEGINLEKQIEPDCNPENFPKDPKVSVSQKRTKVNLAGAVRRLSHIVMLRGNKTNSNEGDCYYPNIIDTIKTTQSTEESQEKKQSYFLHNGKKIRSPKNGRAQPKTMSLGDRASLRLDNTDIDPYTLVRLVECKIRPTDFILGVNKKLKKVPVTIERTDEKPKEVVQPSIKAKSSKRSKKLLTLIPIIVGACKKRNQDDE